MISRLRYRNFFSEVILGMKHFFEQWELKRRRSSGEGDRAAGPLPAEEGDEWDLCEDAKPSFFETEVELKVILKKLRGI